MPETAPLTLDDVSIRVEPGEPVGLIGPNGAGKTTFFNCLLGILRSDRGKVMFNGRNITRLPVYKRARLGFGRTFQRVELFTGMTVRDHLLVAERARLGSGRLWKDILNLAGPTTTERRRADHTLELLGLLEVADEPIESLSLGRARLVEVGRALMTEPLLLLLDEPSSGLDVHETQQLGDALRRVREERGTAFVLVEHNVEFVLALSETVAVLDFGKVLVTGTPDEIRNSSEVQAAYLGAPVGGTEEGA